MKRETTEQLGLFRKQQEEADKLLLEEGGEKKAADGGNAVEAADGQWANHGRKRKRVKERDVLKGVKLRKASTSEAPGTSGKDPLKEAAELRQKLGDKTTSRTSEDSSKEGVEEFSEALPASPAVISAKSSAPEQQDSSKATAAPGLGLGGYSSDEEG